MRKIFECNVKDLCQIFNVPLADVAFESFITFYTLPIMIIIFHVLILFPHRCFPEKGFLPLRRLGRFCGGGLGSGKEGGGVAARVPDGAHGR